jgi:hypothetical protein
MEAKNLKFATKIIYKCSYESHKKYSKLRITDMGTVRKFEVRSDKFNVENIWSLVVGLAEVVVVSSSSSSSSISSRNSSSSSSRVKVVVVVVVICKKGLILKTQPFLER